MPSAVGRLRTRPAADRSPVPLGRTRLWSLGVWRVVFAYLCNQPTVQRFCVLIYETSQVGQTFWHRLEGRIGTQQWQKLFYPQMPTIARLALYYLHSAPLNLLVLPSQPCTGQSLCVAVGVRVFAETFYFFQPPSPTSTTVGARRIGCSVLEESWTPEPAERTNAPNEFGLNPRLCPGDWWGMAGQIRETSKRIQQRCRSERSVLLLRSVSAWSGPFVISCSVRRDALVNRDNFFDHPSIVLVYLRVIPSELLEHLKVELRSVFT